MLKLLTAASLVVAVAAGAACAQQFDSSTKAQSLAETRSQTPRLAITLDRSEADAALAIIDAFNAGREPSQTELQLLFTSRPYLRLRERENSFKVPFTDEQFIAHLRSAKVRDAASATRVALSNWKEESIQAAAVRAAAYLPAGSSLRVTIFPMVKIKPNTFVFDVERDPSIFYTVDPKEPQAKFANTLAHEMHHIGMGQNCALDGDGPQMEPLQSLRRWVGAFNEGLAMLAAAGGPDVHPHADSGVEQRDVWNSEVAKFSEYLKQQDQFFRSVLASTAGTEEEIDKAMFAYFGVQGPWYSVGWRMATTIENVFGRKAVIDAFCRPATLLKTYNEAALKHREKTGETLPLWDSELADALAS